MKIDKLNNINPENYIKKQNKKDEKKALEQKETEAKALELNANYNIAFQGLFGRKKSSAINVPDVRFSDIELDPRIKYNVTPDAVIELGGNLIGLTDYNVSYLTNQMKNKQSITVGRQAYLSNILDDSASRKHLELTKEDNGTYTIQDLNSTNGTRILRNVYKAESRPEGVGIAPYAKFEYPMGSMVKLGKNFLIDISTIDEVKNLPIGGKLVMGRGSDANLRILNDFDDVSRAHLLIEREKEGLVVSDMGSTNGTTLYTRKMPDIFENFQYVNEVTQLTRNVPCIVPNDSQLRLGKGLIIDLRNKNIQKILNERGKIQIGRNLDSDIVVEGFYGTVSNNHLTLEKVGNNIFATDLCSTNGTEVVPKQKARAFFNGAENIEIAQANIGDCYLLSTIYALSRNPYGARLLENMVRIDDKGNYHVNFHNCYPITVGADELDGQQIEGKEKKRSVSGELGVKAIERAYGRRLNRPKDTGMTMYMNLDKGGWPHKTLEDMTGIPCAAKEVKDFSSTAQTLMNIVLEGRDNYIVTCSTPSKPKSQASYFTSNHAYAVGQIDINRQTIEILNPHDTRRHHFISWQEFVDNFDVINFAKVPEDVLRSA